MKTYWTCSKFADWLRGTPKPGSATMNGWNSWYKSAKDKHPFRYWLADDVLGFFEDAVDWPGEQINNVRYYINNRWISRSHSLTAHPNDIKPGRWSDVGNRFLPCMFNELVDFVEVETAWHHCMWDEAAREKYQVPWYRRGWLRLRTWRSADCGIEHLEWAAALTWSSNGAAPGDPNFNKPTGQALAAREILDLYHWWKEERPHRVDANDAGGWSAICEQRRADAPDSVLGRDDNTAAERRASSKALKASLKIEAAYEKEDEQMMIRLIKIRENLWT